MGIAERYARASESSDLTVDLLHRCDADLLIAAGAAGLKNAFGHLVYRSVYTGDRSDIARLKDRLLIEAMGATQKVTKLGREISESESRRVVDQLVAWYVAPACAYCNGTGHVRAQGMHLQLIECDPCHGTGRTPMNAVLHKAFHPLATHLVDLMDRAALDVHSEMARQLKEQSP